MQFELKRETIKMRGKMRVISFPELTLKRSDIKTIQELNKNEF